MHDHYKQHLHFFFTFTSFWSAPGIETCGRVQYLIVKCNKFDWLKTTERVLCACSEIGSRQRSRFLAQTRRIAATGGREWFISTTITDARGESNRNQKFLVPVFESPRAVAFPDSRSNAGSGNEIDTKGKSRSPRLMRGKSISSYMTSGGRSEPARLFRERLGAN